MINKVDLLSHSSIKKIHWNCYNKCNLPCDFCYAWFDNKNILSTEQAKILLDRTRRYIDGEVKFVFGGGDPLLRQDLLELVQYARNKLNFTIELQTNAVRLTSGLLNQLIPFVSIFGFSIDGEDNETHTQMRKDPRNFMHIMNLLTELDNYKKSGTTFQVTIRTLISQHNKYRIKKLIYNLSEHPCITKWSLRQFVPLEEGVFTRFKHEIDISDFHEIVGDIVDYAKLFFLNHSNYTNNIRIVKVDEHDMENCYCLFAPNGDIYYHPDEGNEYIALGNIINSDASYALGKIVDRCNLRTLRDQKLPIFEFNISQ